MPRSTPFDFEEARQRLADRFNVSEIIREGAQGIVCKAARMRSQAHSRTQETVALKFYLDPTQHERVEREIKALEGYYHPNWANLIEHGQIDVHGRSVRYIAWEFVNGEALDQRLQRGPVLPRTVAYIGRDIARAIEHIWEKRIVHRDVKPKNIMLRTGEIEAVLIDLGVARHLSESTITTAGSTWGTAGYLSPEQCRAERQLTCHSDVFSLGVVLQEALYGQHPTDGDQHALLTRPVRTSQITPTPPGAMADLVDSMLRPRAAFRPHPHTLANKFAELAKQLEG